jgi:hypothetical protein
MFQLRLNRGRFQDQMDGCDLDSSLPEAMKYKPSIQFAEEGFFLTNTITSTNSAVPAVSA